VRHPQSCLLLALSCLAVAFSCADSAQPPSSKTSPAPASRGALEPATPLSPRVAASTMATPRWTHTTTLLPNGKLLIVGGTSNEGPLASAELYDPHTGTWSATGSLAGVRDSHTATLLPSGKVLVTGGQVAGTPTATSELYDPATGTWSATGSLATARLSHTAIRLNSGKVLVAGGNTSSGVTATAELYDPATGTWSPAAPMVGARSNHTATLLTSGRVLIAGGSPGGYPTGLATAVLYDESTNTWSATGSMRTTRQNHSSTLLTSGKVLVAGGVNSTAGFGLDTLELYDPATGTWAFSATRLPQGRMAHTATLLQSGDVLIAGGSKPTGGVPPSEDTVTTFRYRAASDTVSTSVEVVEPREYATATILPSGDVFLVGGRRLSPVVVLLSSTEQLVVDGPRWSEPPLPVTGRRDASAALLPSGRVLVTGGYNAGTLRTAELFEPSTGAWSSTGMLSTPRQEHSLTLLPTGKVLAVGGYESGATIPHATAELYDPAAGTWSATSAPSDRRYGHTATLLSSGKVLIAGGYRDVLSSSYADSAELYDPIAGAWSSTGAPTVRRIAHTATVLPSGQVLFVGGRTSSGGYESADLYDPMTGTWRPAAPMQQPRMYHSATLLPSGKVLVAGGYYSTSALTTAELYDPATNTWSPAAPLLRARYRHSAFLLPSGQVVLIAGLEGTSLASRVDVYEPATNAWTTGSSLFAGRHRHTGVQLATGEFLLMGGIPTPSSIDPPSRTAFRGGLPIANLPSAPVLDDPGILTLRSRITLTGSGFRGMPGGSTGRKNDSPADFPRLWMRAAGGDRAFLLPSQDFSATSVSANVPVLPSGYYTLTLGVPLGITGRVVQVTGTNNPPQSQDASLSTAEDNSKAVTLGVLDPDGDPLMFTVLAAPAHGTLSGTPPNLTYTPQANSHGPDSFTFQAHDGRDSSATATVLIDVTPVNDAPVPAPESATTAEDTPLPLVLRGSDVEGDDVSFAVVASPSHGTLSGTPPNLTYTPQANYHGPDSFTFLASDGQDSSAPATFTLTVSPESDAPVATADTVVTDEDVPVAVLLRGSDADGDPLTFTVESAPSHGALSGTPPNLTYAPQANYHGPDSFTFRVHDGRASSTLTTLSLTVQPVNDAPSAQGFSASTPQESPVALTLVGSDIDGDALTFTVVSPPAHGALSGTPPELTYTPRTGFHGTDSFTFQANDGQVSSSPAAVILTVIQGNKAPPTPALLAPNAGARLVDGRVRFEWTASTDPNGDAVSYLIEVQRDSAPFLSHTTAATFLALEAPLPSGSYVWRVRAMDHYGAPSAYSSDRDFLIESASTDGGSGGGTDGGTLPGHDGGTGGPDETPGSGCGCASSSSSSGFLGLLGLLLVAHRATRRQRILSSRF
jgi:MYXO-CTERM domain-containing protein